jgi:hypothetical protein
MSLHHASRTLLHAAQFSFEGVGAIRRGVRYFSFRICRHLSRHHQVQLSGDCRAVTHGKSYPQIFYMLQLGSMDRSREQRALRFRIQLWRLSRSAQIIPCAETSIKQRRGSQWSASKPLASREKITCQTPLCMNYVQARRFERLILHNRGTCLGFPKPINDRKTSHKIAKNHIRSYKIVKLHKVCVCLHIISYCDSLQHSRSEGRI